MLEPTAIMLPRGLWLQTFRLMRGQTLVLAIFFSIMLLEKFTWQIKVSYQISRFRGKQTVYSSFHERKNLLCAYD